MKKLMFRMLPAFLRPLAERVERSPTGARLARGTFWSVTGTLTARSLTLLSSIVVARYLGRESFGELAIIQSTINMVGVFAGFGMGVTATKHVAELRGRDPERAGRILGLSGLVSAGSGALMMLALLALAPWLAAEALAAPQIAGLLRVGAISLFFAALDGAQTGALSGFEAFKTLARLNLIRGLVAFPLIVGGVYLAGLPGAVWGLVATGAVGWLVNHLALRAEAHRFGVPLRLAGAGREWGLLWRFSIPALFSYALVVPINWLCNAILVNQPGGYAEMGAFHAANQWFSALVFLPMMLAQVVLPILSEQMAGDTSRTRRFLWTSVKLNALAAIPIGIVAALASPLIMAFYGAEFADAWPTLVALVAAAALVAVQTPVGQILAASDRMWIGFLTNLGWAAVFVGLTWLLVASDAALGSLGLAAAKGGAYLLHVGWTFAVARMVLRTASPASPST